MFTFRVPRKKGFSNLVFDQDVNNLSQINVINHLKFNLLVIQNPLWYILFRSLKKTIKI